jgi:hypothetical protein
VELLVSDTSAMSPTTIPSEIHIGSRKSFRQGRQFKYIFDERINGYVCDHQTSSSVPGEVLAILLQDDSDASVWYVAVEGRLEVVCDEDDPDGRACFLPRQDVFRTQERFWETGDHEWQVNSQSSSTNTSVTWDGSMTARTEVPQKAVDLAAETQLALTNP